MRPVPVTIVSNSLLCDIHAGVYKLKKLKIVKAATSRDYTLKPHPTLREQKTEKAKWSLLPSALILIAQTSFNPFNTR